ncbi:MAG: T9SS type A sorting domain-containing protein [Bacteroidetes bacterium]|nr:T9SS type A sorting domain-containing protein [Bacteroidota bacterium]
MNRLSVLLFCLFPVFLSGQITYTVDDYANQGDAFQLSIINGTELVLIDFESTGADYSWDFSDLEYSEQTLISHIDPNDSGYKVTWCFINGYIFNCDDKFNELTNLGVIDGAGNPPFEIPGASFSDLVNHQRKTTDAVELTMIGATIDFQGFPVTVPFDYTQPDTVLSLPLEYGNMSSTISELEIDLNDFGVDLYFKSNQTRNNTVDGWGSLQTPYETYDSVIRVNSEIDRIDTIEFMGTTIPIPSTQVEIRWFAKDQGYPVMQANGISLGGQTIINELRYIDTVQCITPDNVVFGAPLSNSWQEDISGAEVPFTNFTQNADQYEWDFGDGNSSGEAEPVHIFACPGVYEVTLSAWADCDPDAVSVSSQMVVIEDTTGYFETAASYTICQGDSIQLGDDYQTEAGVYTFTTTSVAGCDSTVTATLDVQSIDTGVTLIDISLTANAADASYQWVDCENGNAPIAGAVEQSFTPDLSGSYAVEITQDGCTALSECTELIVLGTEEKVLDVFFGLSPNPFSEQLHLDITPALEGDVLIEVIDPLGRVLFAERQENLQEKTLHLQPLPSGMYWVRISQGGGILTKPVIRL